MPVTCWIPVNSVLLQPVTVSGRTLRTGVAEDVRFHADLQLRQHEQEKDKSKSRSEEPDMFDME